MRWRGPAFLLNNCNFASELTGLLLPSWRNIIQNSQLKCIHRRTTTTIRNETEVSGTSSLYSTAGPRMVPEFSDSMLFCFSLFYWTQVWKQPNIQMMNPSAVLNYHSSSILRTVIHSTTKALESRTLMKDSWGCKVRKAQHPNVSSDLDSSCHPGFLRPSYRFLVGGAWTLEGGVWSLEGGN